VVQTGSDLRTLRLPRGVENGQVPTFNISSNSLCLARALCSSRMRRISRLYYSVHVTAHQHKAENCHVEAPMRNAFLSV
jgi:hypothetical protein